MVSSAANASSAAAWMSIGHKRLSGMTESNGSKESRIQYVLDLNSVENFLLSELGRQIRTQACFTMGMSQTGWLSFGWNSVTLAPTGR